MSRGKITPILAAIPAARQEDARHYGVHPYFTRRPANVVRAYIERYSREGDVVLDPFGGTGVTAIEAFLLGRHAIHNDLNPFANFIARSIADTSLESTLPLREAFARVEDLCKDAISEVEGDADAAKRLCERLGLPNNIRLPRNSDADFYYEMFTPSQLAGLGLIKDAIEKESERAVHDSLVLAWSAALAKLNKTFLSAKGRAASRGGSSIFSIYRYKLASKCVELPIWETFRGRFENVVSAKEEVIRLRRYLRQRSSVPRKLDSSKDFVVFQKDAATLDTSLKPGSVDYIFTDPPYGGFISYLDLSILWNHWLGFYVPEDTRQMETIVGGECNLTEEHYKGSLAKSVKACLRLLRPDRWFSIVFQHWELSYFATILESASECGAELKAAITQTGNVIWSMHKKKNSASVIAGEMIITFYKPNKPLKNREAKVQDIEDPAGMLSEVMDACLGNGTTSFTNEALFNRLVIELWHRRALSCLSLDRREFAQRLRERGWNYNPRTHYWSRGRETCSVEAELF